MYLFSTSLAVINTDRLTGLLLKWFVYIDIKYKYVCVSQYDIFSFRSKTAHLINIQCKTNGILVTIILQNATVSKYSMRFQWSLS